MRGDSLRDLYAKTLALFGLALLAGVGALVDYWPASSALPAVASPGLRPVPARLPALASLDVSAILTPAPVAPRPGPGSRPAVTRQVAVRPVADVSLDLLQVADHVPVATGVPLGEAPLQAVVTPVAATRVPAPEIALPPAPVADIVPGTPSAALIDASPDGFFGNATSAFKKTGESIVNTTVRTGASIIKAFGVVGGAFRKVI